MDSELKLTSHFDNLMSIWSIVQKNQNLIPIAEWLVNECIKQADSKEPGFNYKTWWKTIGGLEDLESKFMYLSVCHDYLDHQKWHLKVFDIPLIMVLSELAGALTGDQPDREISEYELKRAKVFKKYPDLRGLLDQTFKFDSKWKAWKVEL